MSKEPVKHFAKGLIEDLADDVLDKHLVISSAAI